MTLNRTESGKTNRQCVRVGYDRREAFVRHYLIHQNASRAYREAGYRDGPGTRQSAHRLLTSAYIQARIVEARQGLLAALDVTVEEVVRRFRDIAFADIAGIVGLHVGACRFCYGVGHTYQWRTPREFHECLAQPHRDFSATGDREAEGHPEGGYGYDASLPPNQDCSECGGEGIPRIVFKDTRVLTDSERAVFAGVVETRYGVNYRFHNQMKALGELAKRIGFYDSPGNPETNPVARLIEELQSRGQMQRIQLQRDWEQSE
jgi:phage terminase small subunit